ncbi:hypothetical protein RYX56_18540 [Alkalihalophilus lindianensis]|uniref:Uncharacterized protein n=1 Tax=Alkalihalophilus lindianensis TaxID=1630542 RepID=A0ABU3XEP0_9BACI|nr:hypothetical protein [Alkalihalophilus lindianensis]MDV2686370.1 hypothetical protein [Alkalihalophilus lindianensis]
MFQYDPNHYDQYHYYPMTTNEYETPLDRQALLGPPPQMIPPAPS